MPGQFSSLSKLTHWTMIIVAMATSTIACSSSARYQIHDRNIQAIEITRSTVIAATLEWHYQRAIVNIEIGRWQAAKMHLDYIFEIDPNYKDVQTKLVDVEMRHYEANDSGDIITSSRSKFDQNDCKVNQQDIIVRNEGGVQHIAHLVIPAAVTKTGEGFVTFDDKQWVNVNPGDRLVVCVEFPEGLSVNGSPSFVTLSIHGEVNGGNHALGVEPSVENQGSLRLIWGNGGLWGSALTGVIHGFWINLEAANTPNDGQTLYLLRASFTVPETMHTNKLQKNQHISIRTVRWQNLSSP